MTDFASVKLRRAFAAWLKCEAAKRGLTMYEFTEEITSRALGGRMPWSLGVGDLAITEGLADIKTGRVTGPFHTADELVESLRASSNRVRKQK